jgi:hypothetical protein
MDDRVGRDDLDDLAALPHWMIDKDPDVIRR